MAFFHCHQKALEFLVLISKSSKDLNFCHIYDLWLTGNRTLCHPIQSVIILVVKQIRLLLHGCLILLPWTTCLIQTELDFTQPYHHYKYNVFVLICVAEVAHLAMSLPCRQVTQVWLLATWVFFLFGGRRGKHIFLVFGMKTKVGVERPQPSPWMHPWSTKDNIFIQ